MQGVPWNLHLLKFTDRVTDEREENNNNRFMIYFFLKDATLLNCLHLRHQAWYGSTEGWVEVLILLSELCRVKHLYDYLNYFVSSLSFARWGQICSIYSLPYASTLKREPIVLEPPTFGQLSLHHYSPPILCFLWRSRHLLSDFFFIILSVPGLCYNGVFYFNVFFMISFWF